MNNKYLKDKYLIKNGLKNTNIVFIEKRLLNKMNYISKDIYIKNNFNDEKLIITFIVEEDIPYIISIKNKEIKNIKSNYLLKQYELNKEDLCFFEFENYIIKDIKNNTIFTDFKQINKLKKVKNTNFIKQKKLDGEVYKLHYIKENKDICLKSIYNKKEKNIFIVKTYKDL